MCISGGWSYVDEKGVTRQAPNFPVRVFDVDSTSGNDLLAYGFTNGIGAFNLCYDNTDTDEGGLVDPAVNFVTSNSRWRVRNTPTSNRAYEFMKPYYLDQTGNIGLGNLKPDDPSAMRAVQTYDAMNQFWQWLPSSCWDANDATADCRQIVINWTPTSTDGTYYSLPYNDVHLAAADPDSRHTVIHEAAHAVMDDVYEDVLLDRPNCNPHRVEKFSSPGCAWTEGFAEWVPASVLNDPYYRFANGTYIPLETPTWGTPEWDDGLAVEGRVAGAMIDLEDAQNESTWDRWAEGGPPRPQWTTFLNGVATPTYYVHFEYDRRLQGFGVRRPGPGVGVPEHDQHRLLRPAHRRDRAAPADTGAARLPLRHRRRRAGRPWRCGGPSRRTTTSPCTTAAARWASWATAVRPPASPTT